jgi:Rieske Fe-S protein
MANNNGCGCGGGGGRGGGGCGGGGGGGGCGCGGGGGGCGCRPADAKPGPSRRTFLGIIVGVINVGVAAAFIGPVTKFIASPLGRRSQETWVPILSEADLPVGTTKEVTFRMPVWDGYREVERGYSLFVRRYEDHVVAFDPSCTHLGCRVEYQGEKNRYFCPCHGGVFDGDGNVVSGPPPKPLEQYPTKIEGGQIWVSKKV